MRRDLLPRLRCPACGSALELAVGAEARGEVERGALRCPACARSFEIVSGIPRCVPPENYGGSFGRQWNRFRTEQLDSSNGTRQSHERFYDVTRFDREALRERWVLDAGCGAGRFAEIAVTAGARVVAVDLSDAVEACRENLLERHPEHLHVAQASLYELPFAPASFDAVYCIGVIQHTPRPLDSVRAVARMVKPGGELALWIYERTWRTYVGTNGWKYALRPLTRRLGHRVNHAFAWLLCALLWPLWFPLLHLGRPGRALLALFPIAARNYAGMKLPPRRLFRCVVLDTLDNYSPAYDSPQRYTDVRCVLEEEGFSEITRTSSGLGLRATRASTRASGGLA